MPIIEKAWQELAETTGRTYSPVEEYRTDDAEIVLVGYGIASRVVQSAINELRADGIKAGMLRPITLFPFPKEKIAELAEKVDAFLSVEMSNGQMIDDIRLAVNGKKPVHLHNRMGGFVPTTKDIREEVVKIMR